ncbi:hypothetical protein [Streptomyces sp. H27-H5]|uniref:hypothetical protein n=1 Tax=Streptomyces sp. H27-H5 TaxID=2996460 RepID=UPI00226F5668|nr:hypothetical protein [Streptomyces sp. H27-H5]MCY0959621.1 hypothetical protein [Streptomyces sp. H27-H5]
MTEEQPATAPDIDPEQLRAAVEQLGKALRAWAEAVAPVVRAAAQALAQAAEAARNARPDDYALAPPPVAPRDRPAWQSPYGPARPRKH